MTAINTILDSGWDTGICAKPSFITKSEDNYRGYKRVIATQRIIKSDDLIGIIDRQYYDMDAFDAYSCKISTMTSEADLENIIKAIKKIFAQYTATSAENILKWEGGDYIPFNGVVWGFEITLLVYKAGIAAF